MEVTTDTAITTEAQLDEFILSDTPKTIEVEAATGDIVSVTEGVTPTVSARSTVAKVCNNGAACLVASQVPLANYGFTGAGTSTGTWTNRIEWRTGNYTAKAWYSYNGTTVGWGVKSGPNTSIKMDKPVTAVQVTIY